MSDKVAPLRLMITDQQRCLTLSSEIDITLTQEDIHLADVVYNLVLHKIRSVDQARVPSGPYRLNFLCTLTSLEDDQPKVLPQGAIVEHESGGGEEVADEVQESEDS